MSDDTSDDAHTTNRLETEYFHTTVSPLETK